MENNYKRELDSPDLPRQASAMSSQSERVLTDEEIELLKNLDPIKIIEVIEFAKTMEKSAKVLQRQMEQINSQVEQLEDQNKKLLEVNEQLRAEKAEQDRQLRILTAGSGVHMQSLMNENCDLRNKIKNIQK